MTASEFVAPAYGERSLGDVVPAVAHALGRPLKGSQTALLLPEAAAYVVLLVDGMGAELLRRHGAAAPFLSSLMQGQEPATAGVPTTTVTSLTSLGTGLVPGVHGMVGFTSRIPGTNRLLNGLDWPDDVDPLEWQPHPTAFSRLAASGVATTIINKRDYEHSALTAAAHRGATFVGADRVGERIAAVVSAAAVRPSLTYVYDADLDWTGHRFGVSSAQWLQQLTMVDAEAQQLRKMLPSDTKLLVIADHGMVDSPPQARLDVDAFPTLRDGVSLVGGEARFRHLYCAPGAADDVTATWREFLGDRADVVTRHEAIRRGWFGAAQAGVLPRLGDVMVACHADTAIMSSRDFPYENRLIGLHGSLTPDEMLIPMIVA